MFLFFSYTASYDMNDKTSIFLYAIALHPLARPLSRYSYKKFICKMRQRIDGISAHESSNGNRISCLKRISFHFLALMLAPSRSSLSWIRRVEFTMLTEMMEPDQQSCWWIIRSCFIIKLCNCEIGIKGKALEEFSSNSNWLHFFNFRLVNLPRKSLHKDQWLHLKLFHQATVYATSLSMIYAVKNLSDISCHSLFFPFFYNTSFLLHRERRQT